MRKIIIAFDIGTTFSGVSYCVTEGRGSTIKTDIKGVNQFPGQADDSASSKIPSHLLYLGGDVFKVGEEVDEYEQDGSPEAENTRALCKKVRWFKLQLRPEGHGVPEEQKLDTQLPRGVSAVAVYADFLRYLWEYTKQHLEGSLANGDVLFQDKSRLRFIITHPNGWEPPQQRMLREAAKQAGLIDHDHDARLHLLTEGEAAVHFCTNGGISTEALLAEEGIIVIDAGGGTIDLSAYRRCSTDKNTFLKLEEIVTSMCLIKGSVFVNKRAEVYLTGGPLFNSRFRSDIPTILKDFENNTKRRFGPNTKDSYIQFGRDNDEEISSKIRRGCITIPSHAFVEFFEPSINAIIEAVDQMKKKSAYPIKHVFLVGGFSGNRWLKAKLKEALDRLGIRLTCPLGQLSKAVADGAVAYYLNQYVNTRVARETYGTKCYTLYDSNNPEHVKRKPTHHFIDKADGKEYITGLFYPIILKGTQVRDTEEFRAPFFRKFKSIYDPEFENPLCDEIICYRGKNVSQEMQFRDSEPEMYETMFTLQSTLGKAVLEHLQRVRCKNFKQLDYDIIFFFGLTEMKVQATITRKHRNQYVGSELQSFEPKIVFFDREDDD